MADHFVISFLFLSTVPHLTVSVLYKIEYVVSPLAIRNAATGFSVIECAVQCENHPGCIGCLYDPGKNECSLYFEQAAGAPIIAGWKPMNIYMKQIDAIVTVPKGDSASSQGTQKVANITSNPTTTTTTTIATTTNKTVKTESTVGTMKSLTTSTVGNVNTTSSTSSSAATTSANQLITAQSAGPKCPSFYALSSINGACYKLVATPQITGNDAAATCARENASLATMDNMAITNYLQSLALNTPGVSMRVFAGARNDGTSWTWQQPPITMVGGSWMGWSSGQWPSGQTNPLVTWSN